MWVVGRNPRELLIRLISLMKKVILGSISLFVFVFGISFGGFAFAQSKAATIKDKIAEVKADKNTCKNAFKTAAKNFEDKKDTARSAYLVSLKDARGKFQAAYKLAREHKSNDAKEAASAAYDAAKKAAQNKYAADKKTAKDAWQSANDVYHACLKAAKPSPTPTPTATPHN